MKKKSAGTVAAAMQPGHQLESHGLTAPQAQ